MNEILLSRKEASTYLQKKFGGPCGVSPATLAKLACVGGGPKFKKIGRRVGYQADDLDIWVRERIQARPVSTVIS